MQSNCNSEDEETKWMKMEMEEEGDDAANNIVSPKGGELREPGCDRPRGALKLAVKTEQMSCLPQSASDQAQPLTLPTAP